MFDRGTGVAAPAIATEGELPDTSTAETCAAEYVVAGTADPDAFTAATLK